MDLVLPGSTIGIFGGGQLGRMSGIAARELGYGVRIFEPGGACPAAAVADSVENQDYLDLEAVRQFATSVDVITYEFENIPAAALEAAESIRPVLPTWRALHICQHREREKLFLREKGFPCAPFVVVSSAEELKRAAGELGYPCVAKTAAFGYDGKGQRKLHSPADVDAAWSSLASKKVVVEQWITFEKELSVVCARGRSGTVQAFPVVENIHTNHILDLSIAPARIPGTLQRKAARLAVEITEALDIVGLLAVELFLTSTGEILVNELAPRPHNSGHFTIDACATSQFEQHIRAVCGLPLGNSEALIPSVMLNILGDAWEQGPPAWEDVLTDPLAKLHLYGKEEARPGRKMGHITFLGDNALERAIAAKQKLS